MSIFLACTLYEFVPSKLPPELLRVKFDFTKKINLIWAVQSSDAKHFASRIDKISLTILAVRSHRGAYRDRHERGIGRNGRRSID
jgi:hypothetical protein